MTTPRLAVGLVGDRPYCRRCGQSMPGGVETFMGSTYLRLLHGPRTAWIEVVSPQTTKTAEQPQEFVLKRRRRPSIAIGAPVNARGAWARPGDVVDCPNPRCGARQVVPSLRRR